MKKFIYLLFFLLITLNGFTQKSSIKFGYIGQKEGLSQSDVLAIKQTGNGLLWFGTKDGLNSYNGYEFKVYSHRFQDSTSISNSYIHTILEENDSLLWVGTENGLNIFNSATQQFTNIFNDKTTNKRKVNVWALAKDSLGNLWV